MATLATATEKKAQMSPDEKPERKPQRGRVDDRFKIFCGTANEPLCDEVCAFLGLTRGQALVTRFSRMCVARMCSWCSRPVIRWTSI
jgi:ribose-phosphate pyrophosphokinase